MFDLFLVLYFGFFIVFKMEVDIVVLCVLIFLFIFLCLYVCGNCFEEVLLCLLDGVEWRE